jgi:hypothetical protein
MKFHLAINLERMTDNIDMSAYPGNGADGGPGWF